MNVVVDDPVTMRSAWHCALAFEIALLRYRLPEYPGCVYILGSAERWGQARSHRNAIRRRLTGEVHMFDVRGAHEDVHDRSNELFASKLRAPWISPFATSTHRQRREEPRSRPDEISGHRDEAR